MTNQVQLHANDGSQVRSAQHLSILTEEPNTWLLMFSGIAMQRQYSQDDFWGNTGKTEATVEIALANVSGVMLEYTTIAAPSITYVDDDLVDIGILETWVEHADNGDLRFHASTYVYGDGGFAGFAYHASVKLIIDEASIEGTIRWRKDVAKGITPAFFSITAITQKNDPSSQFIEYEVVSTGSEGTLMTNDPTYYYVPYAIRGALLGKAIEVSVVVNQSRFDRLGKSGTLSAHQIAGPQVINLTTNHRHELGVDFELELIPAPK